MLLLVVLYFLSQRSYKPDQRPLSHQVDCSAFTSEFVRPESALLGIWPKFASMALHPRAHSALRVVASWTDIRYSEGGSNHTLGGWDGAFDRWTSSEHVESRCEQAQFSESWTGHVTLSVRGGQIPLLSWIEPFPALPDSDRRGSKIAGNRPTL